MRALIEMTEGLEKLKSIISEFPPDSPHWNEAQNRFQFIDRLLTECLGWQKPDITPEFTDEGGGRADYSKTMAFKAYLERQWHDANIQKSYYNFINLLDVGRQSFDVVERVVEAKQRIPRPIKPGRAGKWKGRA